MIDYLISYQIVHAIGVTIALGLILLGLFRDRLDDRKRTRVLKLRDEQRWKKP